MTVGDRRTTVEARRTTAEALVPGFRPETELERAVAHDPELVEGLAWGRPRAGHPEGPVGAHVSHLLRTIDAWEEGSTQRSELRFVAIVHDSRKVAVHEWLPRRGENHHAMRARRLAERYTRDERLLATIELHDRPYSIWRRRHHGVPLEPALERLFARTPDPALFLRFVELDGSTEGKNSEPIDWFRHELARRALL